MATNRAPILVVALGKTVIGFDAFTGERLWEQDTPGTSTPRLAVLGDCVFVLSNGVQCLRMATGELVWQGAEGYGETFLVAHGVVLVGTGGGEVTAYSAADGRLLWHDGLQGKGMLKIAFAMEGGPVVQIDQSR